MFSVNRVAQGDEMDELLGLRVKIKPGQTGRLTSFLRGLKDRPAEVVESLLAERIRLQSAFLDRQPDADYLYFYARVHSVDGANAVFDASPRPLDAETKAIMAETWGETQELELLVDLETAQMLEHT